MYFNDGSIEGACPPLKALLHIMRDGSFEGKRLDSPEMRDMFTFENIRKSEWYAERLIGRQQIEVNELQRKLCSTPENQQKRVAELKAQLKLKKGIGYLKSLAGTLGADPYIAM